MNRSAHTERFTWENPPQPEWQAEFLLDLPGRQFPRIPNCAIDLLEAHVVVGRGDRPCLRVSDEASRSYAGLQRQALEMMSSHR